MSVLKAVLYGVIQGITEFIPISSSGHLSLIHNFFDETGVDYLPFDVLLHLATLLSVCFVLRRDVALLFKGFFTLMKKLFTNKLKNGLDYGEKLFVMLFIASLPLIPIAFIADRLEYIAKTSWIIGVFMIINGCMLFFSDEMNKSESELADSDYQKPFFIGVFQLFGVLPGISRSGSTITGGLVFGLKREEAVRFSFLMSIPAILGACVKELPKLFRDGGIQSNMVTACAAGALTAAVVGFFAIKLLQYIARKKGFGLFSVYCILIGLSAIITDFLK